MVAGGGRRLIVFAREPVPGACKTRLARSIGEPEAARLYEAFLRDTLAACRRVRDAALTLAFSPPGARDWFARLDPQAGLWAQPEGDLGERMREAFEQAFADGATQVVLVGSDLPQLSSETLEAAFAELAKGRGAIGPSADGGYYLLALPRPCPGLLQGIDWSTPRVLEQTRERARAAGLELHALATEFDIDEPADLERLRARIAAEGSGTCPHTAAVL